MACEQITRADRRKGLLAVLEEQKAVNLDAPLRTMIDIAQQMDAASLTIVYDDDKYFAVLPLTGSRHVTEREIKAARERRTSLLALLEDQHAVNLEAPLRRTVDSIRGISGDLGDLSLTIVYDDDKWFAIMP